MYKIDELNDGFKKYVISDASKGMSFCIIPELGGLVTELEINHSQILYLDHEMLKRGGSIRAGGFPILFPICGRLNDGRAIFEGDWLEIQKHGFARSAAWSIENIDLGETGSITLSLDRKNAFTEIDKSIQGIYPYDFSIKYSFILDDSGFKIKHSIANPGTNRMPFYAGFHPFFSAPDKSALNFAIDVNTFEDYSGESPVMREYEGQIDFNRPVDFVFKAPDENEHVYRISDTKMKRAITIKASREYEYVVLWTQSDKGFICLEPWMGKPDALTNGKGLKILEPGSACDAFISIGVSDL